MGPSTSAIVEAAQPRHSRAAAEHRQPGAVGLRSRSSAASRPPRPIAPAPSPRQIAQDKELTRTLLHAVGVPVPEGRPVADADDAWAAAGDIGVPVVVKPRDGNQGRGVATNLTTREQVLAAYQAALAESDSKQVIVEKFAPGHDYRLLVVGGKVVAAARREPAQVLGDGVRHRPRTGRRGQPRSAPRRTSRHRAEQDQARRRGPGRAGRSRLHARVRPAGRHRGPHPPQRQPEHRRHGHRRDRAGPSPGGGPRRGSGRRSIGLDIAGVDVVATDISRPLEEQGGVIVEVNAAPGLRMHLQPSVGISRPVGEAIVGHALPRRRRRAAFPSPP